MSPAQKKKWKQAAEFFALHCFAVLMERGGFNIKLQKYLKKASNLSYLSSTHFSLLLSPSQSLLVLNGHVRGESALCQNLVSVPSIYSNERKFSPCFKCNCNWIKLLGRCIPEAPHNFLLSCC